MPIRLRAFVVLLPVAFAAAGCSNKPFTDRGLVYEDTISNTTSTVPSVNNERTNLKDAYKHYKKGIEEARTEQLWTDIPLIGLAAGTLASIVYKGSTDLTIGLGLATGAIGAFRVYSAPPARIQANMKGLTGVECVSQNFEQLVAQMKPNTTSIEVIETFAELKKDISTARASGDKELAIQDPKIDNAEIAVAFKLTQTALRDAVVAAKAAIGLADDAERAVTLAPNAAQMARHKIKTAIAQLIVAGTQDLSAARAELAQGVADAVKREAERDKIRGVKTAQVEALEVSQVVVNATASAGPKVIRQLALTGDETAAQAIKRMAALIKTIASDAPNLATRATAILAVNDSMKACPTA